MQHYPLKFALNSEILLIFSTLLGVLWSAFLWGHKRGDRQANRFLGLLVFVLSMLIFRRIADPEASTFYQWIYALSHGFIYLIGPSFYLYIKSKLGHHFRFKEIWKHFIPWVGSVLLINLVFAYKVDLSERFSIPTLRVWAIVFISLQVTHLLTYIYHSRKLVVGAKDTLSHRTSATVKIRHQWLQFLMVTSFILGGFIVLLNIMIITGGYYQINNTADFLFLCLLGIILLAIIYRSWRQPEVVSGIYTEENKYQNKKIPDEQSKLLRSKLEFLIEQQVYLTPDLSLKDLAGQMEVSSHRLSQLINEQYQQNFFNFINDYRIDFATNKIKQGSIEKMTIEALAYDSGFNSKTTFNRAFKKRMQCTPMEYYRSLHATNS